MKYHQKKWASVNKEVKETSNSISEALSCEKQKYEFTTNVESMLKSVSNDRFYQSINILFNKLASHFDDKATEIRIENAQKNRTQYLPSKHVFLITPKEKNDDEPHSIKARMHHSMLPPDERLVQIKVGKKALCLNPHLSILHEMGHYLGMRFRNERYFETFLPLIMNTFWWRVYQNTCIAFSGWDESNGRCNFLSSILITSETRTFAHQVIEIINQLMPKISQDFYAACNETTQEILKHWKNTGFGEATSLDDKENTALNQKFLSSVKAVVLANLRGLIEYMINQFDSLMDMINIQTTTSADASSMDEIKVKLRVGLEKTAQELGNRNSSIAPFWYDDCEKELEEPVADIFMLKVSGMSTKKYISHLLRLYRNMAQNRVKNNQSSGDVDSLVLEYILKDENSSRIIGIVLAQKESVHCFEQWYDSIVKHFSCKNKYWQFYQARSVLKDMYYNMCNNPTQHQQCVFEYIRKVWNDKRYDKEIATMRKSFNNARRWQKPWAIAKSFFSSICQNGN